jgi:hypothetical protein
MAGFLQFVGVAEGRDKAMPPGYITEATQRAGVQGQTGRTASLPARQKARATTRMEDIVERGYVIIGSPNEVVE